VEHKDALTPLEIRLVECAAAGEELDCAPTGSSALQAGAEGLKQHSRLYSAASTTNARRFILRREGNYV
jgi:hypothetical protein